MPGEAVLFPGPEPDSYMISLYDPATKTRTQHSIGSAESHRHAAVLAEQEYGVRPMFACSGDAAEPLYAPGPEGTQVCDPPRRP